MNRNVVFVVQNVTVDEALGVIAIFTSYKKAVKYCNKIRKNSLDYKNHGEQWLGYDIVTIKINSELNRRKWQ